MDAKELRAKSAEDLEKEFLELSREAFNLRMQKGRDVRRNIARVKTIMNERRRAESK